MRRWQWRGYDSGKPSLSVCDIAQTDECRRTTVPNAGVYLRVFQFIHSTRKGTIMNAKFSHRMCAVALGAALCLPTSAVMAEIVTTDQMAAQDQTAAEKSRIQTFVDRAEVKVRLQALGVGESMAKDRVAAMTDQEVHALAQKIDAMPAGGYLSDRDLTLILLIVLLLLLI